MSRPQKIIAFDLDNTLTNDADIPKFPTLSHLALEHYYANTPCNEAMADVARNMKLNGHRILIYTARHDFFETETRQWLKRNGIPYDTLTFGKPYFNVLIDDRAVNAFDIVGNKEIYRRFKEKYRL